MGRVSQNIREVLKMGYNIQQDEEKDVNNFVCPYTEKKEYEKCRVRCYASCGKVDIHCPYKNNANRSNGNNVCPYAEKKEYAKCNTKVYSECACQDRDCPYTMEKLRKKEETKVMVVNKKDIKRTKVGKFSVEVWPMMVEKKDKLSSKDEVVIATGVKKDDDEEEDNIVVEYEVGEGHMIRRLRDLDKMKEWKFMGRNGEDVYEEVLNFIVEFIQDSVWNVSGDNPTRSEHMRKQISRSISKAIKRKRFSFKKLEDILDGHQIWEGTEREDLKEDIIGQVRDYLEAFLDETPKTDEEKDNDVLAKWDAEHEERGFLEGGTEKDEEEEDWKESEGETDTVVSDERRMIEAEMEREQREETEDFQAEAKYVREWSEQNRKRKNHGLDEYGQPESEED